MEIAIFFNAIGAGRRPYRGGHAGRVTLPAAASATKTPYPNSPFSIINFQFVIAAAGIKQEGKRQEAGEIAAVVKRIKERKDNTMGKEKTEIRHLVLSWLTTLHQEDGRH